MRRDLTPLVVLLAAGLVSCSGSSNSAVPPLIDPVTVAPTTTTTTAASTTTTAASTTSTTSPEASVDSVTCDHFGSPVAQSKVQDVELDEISGAAIGRRNADVIWVHNDSGDSARVFAVSQGGSTVATVALADTLAFDWEDMSVGAGPGPETTYLYVADMGDNFTIRPTITVHRFEEPAITATARDITVDAETVTLTYPDGPHDAEALLIDPATGDIIVVTKTDGAIYTAPGSFATGRASLVLAGKLAETGILVTGADTNATGTRIVIRTPERLLLFVRTGDAAMIDTLTCSWCDLPTAAERQGESVAMAPDGSYIVTISEGDRPDINRVEEE